MTTDNNTTAKTMDAWDMATSVLSGVRKAARKAHEELKEIQDLNQSEGTPFGNGISSKYALIEALDAAEQSLLADLGQVARANNLPMPRE